MTEKDGIYLESRFLKVFKEDIFTLRALHSSMILRIPQKEKNSQPTSLLEKYFLKNENLTFLKFNNNVPDLYYSDRLYTENVKDFNHEFNLRFYYQLEEDLKSFGQGISDRDFFNYICRNAIHFTFTGVENYFFKCFYELYRKFPEKIQSKEVKLKEFIKHNFNGQRVLDVVAYDEAEKIHKTPIKKILYEAKVKHGIDHQIDSRKINQLEALKQIRNIFTHGDGTITRRYLKKVKPSAYKLGEKYKLNLKMVDYYQSLALEVLKKFDKALIDKFPDFKAANRFNSLKKIGD